MPDLRRDLLSGRELVVAPRRGARPHEARGGAPVTCPFCPGNEAETPQAVLELRRPGAARWSVRVVPNLYPIVENAHEVIVETPEHGSEMSLLAPEELILVLQAYRERYRALLAEPGSRYVALFKNKGAAAGNSLVHPHSQIVALLAVPEEVRRMTARWRRHYRRYSACLLCDAIARERKQATRVIQETRQFIAYVPPGGPIPGEALIAPLEHSADFGSTTDDALEAFAQVLGGLIGSLRDAGDPAYNLLLRTWPRDALSDPGLHWYAEVVPRTSVYGGFELVTGVNVATTTPEEDVRLYRGSSGS